MANCQRGCTGVNICNGQICCIQFQQDCGTDCVGIASGFSRIQVNDLGELVICSNVGGTCTCQVVGGGGGFLEDTLVDNNDGTITHTSNQGNPSTIDVCALLAYCEVSDLSDVQTALPTVDQALIWNGVAWENQDLTGAIDVCAIVAANCNTSLVDNANGTITFTDNAAAANIIDICGIVAASCDIGVADNGDGTITITDISGTPQVLDICDIVSSHCLAAIDVCGQVAAGCNSSLVDQGDGTFIFTDNAGNPTTINICNMVNLGGCTDSMAVVGSVVTHTALNGNVQAFDVCNLIAAGGCTDTLTIVGPVITHTSIGNDVQAFNICDVVAINCDITITDNNNGTFTITDIQGNPFVLDVCNMVADGGCTDALTVLGSVVTHISLDGTIDAFDICAIVAANCNPSLLHVGAGIIQFTDVGGGTSNIDICAMVAAGGCTDVLVNNNDGTYTHTALDGVVEIIDICAAITVADTACITMIQTPTATGCQLSASPILSPDDCQGLECRINGLWMNGDIGGFGVSHQQPSEIIVAAGGLPATCVFQGTSNFIQLDNPSVCNDMWGQILLDGSEIFISNFAGADAGLTWSFETQLYFNGAPGGWNSSSNNSGNMVAAAGTQIYTIPLAGTGTPFRTLPGTFTGIEYRFCIFNPDGNFNGEVRIEFRGMGIWGITTPL